MNYLLLIVDGILCNSICVICACELRLRRVVSSSAAGLRLGKTFSDSAKYHLESDMLTLSESAKGF